MPPGKQKTSPLQKFVVTKPKLDGRRSHRFEAGEQSYVRGVWAFCLQAGYEKRQRMAAWNLRHEKLKRKGIGSRKLYFVFP
jgi:hypothetical protein